MNDLLALKEKLQNCSAILSMRTKRCDNEKASAIVNLVDEQLSQLIIDIIDNKNISDKHLSRHGLHVSNHGWVRLAMNFISYRNKL